MSTETGRVLEGDVLAQRYRIEKPLGAGSMAFVVLAHDMVIDELVACKIPLDASEARTQAIKRQHRLFRKLNTRNLQTLIAYERHREAGREFDFLVFEYVRGDSLQDWYPARPLRQRLEALATIAETLAGLAAEGATHGDLDPSNVVVGEGGRVVLIDPEAAEYGSSRSSALVGGRILDMSGFKSIAEMLLPVGGGRDVLRGLFDRMNLIELHALTLQEIGGGIRHVLSLPFLPGENNALGTLASAYTKKILDDRATFTQVVDLRDLAFRNICDLLRRLVAPFNIAADDNLDSNRPVPPAFVLQREAESTQLGRGMLHHRSMLCTSTHGDQMGLFVHAQSEIRKPWPFPDRPGLISRGVLNVLRDSQSILTHQLELWLRDGVVLTFVFEAGRYRPLDESVLEGAIGVLIEQVFPGLESPVADGGAGPTWPMLRLNHMKTVKRWCGGRKVPEPKIESDWLKVFVEVALTTDILFPPPASKAPLRRFFEMPRDYSSRFKLVREAAVAFRQAYGAHFSPLYRLDVSVADELEGRIKVAFEGGTVSHSFEADVPTIAMIAEKARANSARERTAAVKATAHRGSAKPKGQKKTGRKTVGAARSGRRVGRDRPPAKGTE